MRFKLSDSSPDGLSAKVAKGGAIALLGQGATRVLSFVLQLVLSNGLGVKLYGVYSLAVNLMDWGQQIFLLGTPSGLVRFTAAYGAHREFQRLQGILNSASFLGLFSSFLGVGILFGLSETISERFLHDPIWAVHLRWFSLALPFAMFLSLLQALMRGFQRIDRMVVLGIGRGVVQLFVATFLIGMGLSLAGAIGAYLIGLLCGVTMGIVLLRKMGWHLFRGKVEGLRELLTFSVPVFLASLSHLVVSRLDLLLLGYFRGAEEVGLYRAAVTVASMVSFLLGAMNTAFAPLISELHHSGKNRELEAMYERVTRWVLMVALPLCVIICIFSSNVLQIFGRGFKEAWEPLVILAIAQLCNSATGSVGFLLQMTGKERWFMVNYMISAAVNASSNMVLIPALGATGAAIGTGLSIVLVNGLGIVELWVFRRIHPWSRFSILYLVAGAISALVGAALQWGIGLWPISVGGALFAYLVIVGKKGLSHEDKRLASSLWYHLRGRLLG